MGMYTEFHFNTELKRDIPDEIRAVLDYMVGNRDDEPATPEHPLFCTTRWRMMLRSGSYYFDADTHSTLRDDEQGGSYLCIRCNLKNHDDEIEKFCDWVRPYIDKCDGDFLGFSRYEATETPTLIFA